MNQDTEEDLQKHVLAKRAEKVKTSGHPSVHTDYYGWMERLKD